MNDFKVVRTVRVVLTKLRLDSRVLTIRYSKGVLHISGPLRYPFGVEGYRPDLSFELLHEMDRQLQRVPGVQKIQYAFDNWSHNSDGHWGKKTPRTIGGPARSVLLRAASAVKPA